MQQEVKEPWDGVERRTAQAPVGVTALNVSKRAVDKGKTDIDPDDVRAGDIENADLKGRVGKILDTVNRDEAQEQNTALLRFKAEYDKLPVNLKVKCHWKVAQARLLANDGEKLKLAQAMEQGGLLFGVDKDGKLLFADKGDDLIMKGMSYPDTRVRVLFKHSSLDEDGQMELDEDYKPIPTGYTMFPYSTHYEPSAYSVLEPSLAYSHYKSEEINMFESCIGKPYGDLSLEEKRKYVSSWLESGENARNADTHCLDLDPGSGRTYVNWDDPQVDPSRRGVRRLLRV